MSCHFWRPHEWPWGSGKRQLVLTLMHDFFGELEAETMVRKRFIAKVKFPKKVFIGKLE